LYENKIFYNYCRRTNGTTMLKSADHDSMSGEPIGTTPGMIVTSGKSGIWPLATLKIRDLERCENSHEEKRPRHFCFGIYGICEEAGHCLVCRERTTDFLFL
jgi:hypothetical protein